MCDLTGQDFLKTLSSISINIDNLAGESFDWLFDDETTRPLLNWLCTNINENNVLSNIERQEYETLLSENKIFTGDELSNQINEINITHPGILDENVEDEINDLQVQINCAQKENVFLCSLASKTLAFDHKLNHELSIYSEKEAKTVVQLKNITDKYLSESHLLGQIHKKINSLMENYNFLLNQLSNPISDKYFLFQIPLDSYKQQCDDYNAYLNLWIKMTFNTDKILQMNTKYLKHGSNFDNLYQELQRLCNCIRKSIIERIKCECGEQELTGKLEYLEGTPVSNVQFSKDVLSIQTTELTLKINSLSEELNRLYTTKLEIAAQCFTDNLINSVLFDFAKEKNNNNNVLLDHSHYLNSEVIKSLGYIHLISMFFNVEKQNHDALHNLMTEVDLYMNKYYQNLYVQLQNMRKIDTDCKMLKSLPLQEKCLIIKQIFMLITNNYTIEDQISLEIAIIQKQNDQTQIDQLTNTIFMCSNKKHMEDVRKIAEKMKQIKKFIWCGPTLQSACVPYSYLEKSYNTKYCLDRISKKLDTCIQKYAQAQSKLHKDVWFKERRLLWVWFLMQPKHILSTINKLKQHVIEENKHNKPVQDVEQFVLY